MPKPTKWIKEGDAVFIKKVPVHQRDRLARTIKKKEQEKETSTFAL